MRREGRARLGRRAAELTRANTSPDLVVVPTPLGEPADLTVRAIAALAAADAGSVASSRRGRGSRSRSRDGIDGNSAPNVGRTARRAASMVVSEQW